MPFEWSQMVPIYIFFILNTHNIFYRYLAQAWPAHLHLGGGPAHLPLPGGSEGPQGEGGPGQGHRQEGHTILLLLRLWQGLHLHEDFQEVQGLQAAQELLQGGAVLL